jgi:hypothetical protein
MLAVGNADLRPMGGVGGASLALDVVGKNQHLGPCRRRSVPQGHQHEGKGPG